VTGPSGEASEDTAYRVVSETKVDLTGVATEADAEDVTVKSFTPNEAKAAVDKIEKLIKIANDTSQGMKEAIDVETKVINTSKSKFQQFKEGMESAANKAKSWVGRVMSVMAKPFGPLVRFIHRVIAGALYVVSIMLGVVTAVAGAGALATGLAGNAVQPG
jgi:hypothetical protein